MTPEAERSEDAELEQTPVDAGAHVEEGHEGGRLEQYAPVAPAPVVVVVVDPSQGRRRPKESREGG